MNVPAVSVDDAVNTLLVASFRNRIVEPNVEAGFERFVQLTNGTLTEAAFHSAVAGCLSRRLIHDPVRLVEGSLQCHWHFELTSAGMEVARQMIARDGS